jgi:hypothetical protein
VELVRRYCNRPDLLQNLAGALSRASKRGDREREPANAQWGRIPGTRLERLTEADVQCLIGEFLAGTPKWQLAERYAVSMSTVKRILKKHGVRRANKS